MMKPSSKTETFLPLTHSTSSGQAPPPLQLCDELGMSAVTVLD
jgi:hypothetical protein